MCNDVSEAFDWAPVRGMLRQPLGGRMPGHREPQQLPPSVTENKKCEELFKGNRRNHKEINRSDDISVVAKEGFPGLQWPVFPRYHILRDTVDWATSKPSLRSSPWMCGPPQS